MANCSFFCGLVGSTKKVKGKKKSSETADKGKVLKTLYAKLGAPSKTSEKDELKTTSFSVPVPFSIPGPSRCKVKVMNHESPVEIEVEEVTYEGEDERDESLSMKRDNSDFDLQAHAGYSNEENVGPVGKGIMNFCNTYKADLSEQCERITEKDIGEAVDTAKSGHLSDPGIGKARFWASPKLLRSCSDLGTRDMLEKVAGQLPATKSQSFEELQKLAEKFNQEVLPVNPGSPLSVRTHYSADKVILKKHSSSQILPSRSRKLWWKLFLWSHRNLHTVGELKPLPVLIKPALNQQGGYSSDTLEPRGALQLSVVGSPNSFAEECLKHSNCDNDNQSWDGFHGTSGWWPQNQWVAFPGESSTMSRVDELPQNQWANFPGEPSTMSRVEEWVKGLSMQPPLLEEKDDQTDNSMNLVASPEAGSSPIRSSSHFIQHPTLNVPEEISHANSVIQSLNSSSTVAHIVGIGLRVVPHLSSFSSLRSVNLSGNFIVHVTPGLLPKGLHTLNLSKNKISAIEGLRELTRLRILDLSYNRITRIGQGLSSCTLIKELYLAGNKISDAEGLHRLLKLTVLDLSFNKITTTKALGQLVANYNSLLALNLLGNPIQSNVGDDQLRKTVCSILPNLAFLNKQPANPQKAREVGKEAIAKVALGSSSWSTHRRAARKSTQGGSSSSGVHRSSASAAHKSRHKSKSRVQHQHSSTKAK